MRKSLLFFIGCFLLSIQLCGQNQIVVDSLLRLTKSEISEQELVDIYLKIAFEHIGSDSTGARIYVSKALAIADSIDYQQGKMDAMYVLSRSSLLSGDYAQSDLFIKELFKGSRSMNYDRGIANAFYGDAWLSYYQGDYDESIRLHLQSLEIRRTLGDSTDISDCLRGIGISYKLKGDFDLALSFLEESLSISEAIGDRSSKAKCLNHIGIINSLRGNYSLALEIYFQSLEIEKQLDDKSGMAYTYQSMGIVHEQLTDYDKALSYYDESLKLRVAIGERRGVAQIINNIGIVYHKLGNYQDALKNYEEALSIKEDLGDKRGVADGNLNIGRLYADQGNHQEAIEYKRRALDIFNEIDSEWGKVEALISLGRSYYLSGELAVAKKYTLDGIWLANASKLLASIRDGSKLLAQITNDLGDHERAYEAMVVFQQMADSISTVENAKRIALLEANFEFQQERDSIQFANEKERLILDQQIKSQRTTQFLTCIGLAMLIVILAILLGFYRYKTVSNRKLSDLNRKIRNQNDSLRAINEEKNNLIGIVAHDLQNPLAGIRGSIDLLDANGMDEEQKMLLDIIEMNSARMSKMISEILDVEALDEGQESVNLVPYNLSSAVDDLCQQFSNRAAQKSIIISNQVSPDIKVAADERYVIQVVENLISNAIKFSPPNRKVIVNLARNEKDAILKVQDEGPGLTEEDKKKLFQKFQRLSAKPTAGESSTGLGLANVKTFVEKMGGSIWCESKYGSGASFFVSLPLA